MKNQTDSNVTIPAVRNRKAYVSPEFVEYGDFRMITRSSRGGNRDGASGDDGADDLAGTV
jgi:hypothetical protein